MPPKRPTYLNLDSVRPNNQLSKSEEATKRFNDFYQILENNEKPKKITFRENPEVIDCERSYEEKDFSKKQELTLLQEAEPLLPENRASDTIEANLKLATKNKGQSYYVAESKNPSFINFPIVEETDLQRKLNDNQQAYGHLSQQTEQGQLPSKKEKNDILNSFFQEPGSSFGFALSSTSEGTNQQRLDWQRQRADSSAQHLPLMVTSSQNHESHQFQTDKQQLSQKNTEDTQETHMQSQSNF